jgi:hypothetical protein
VAEKIGQTGEYPSLSLSHKVLCSSFLQHEKIHINTETLGPEGGLSQIPEK